MIPVFTGIALFILIPYHSGKNKKVNIILFMLIIVCIFEAKKCPANLRYHNTVQWILVINKKKEINQ